jgi:hypothetical protein
MSIPFEIASLAVPRRSEDSGPTKPEFDERLMKGGQQTEESRDRMAEANSLLVNYKFKSCVCFANYAEQLPLLNLQASTAGLWFNPAVCRQ